MELSAKLIFLLAICRLTLGRRCLVWVYHPHPVIFMPVACMEIKCTYTGATQAVNVLRTCMRMILKRTIGHRWTAPMEIRQAEGRHLLLKFTRTAFTCSGKLMN